MNSRLPVFRPWLVAGLVLILAGAGTAIVAQPPESSGAPQAAAPLLSPEQLDNLVAPIALYPDPLLSQVLAASTYPLEIVEAQQWLQNNRGLTGSRRIDAARQHDWDPSVQALVAFPDVLVRLNQDIRWTTDLGNAFLAQESDVMAAVQRMRASARDRGRLYSTAQQTVTTDTENGQSAIVIEPASPEVIYVPTYDPMYVWGPPVLGYYPALYYPAFGFGFGPGFDIGIYFGGWGIGGWGGWGAWGWGPNWFGRGLYVNRAFFHNYGFRGGFRGGGGYVGGFGGGFAGRAAWTHDPAHRLGVAYPNRQLAGRFQAASRAGVARMASRNAFGQSSGGNRGTFRGQGTGRQFGNRAGAQGNQSFRNAAPQGSMRNFQGGAGSQSRQSFQTAPRSMAPGNGRGARSFGGGGVPARNFAGGGARSFGGGGVPARGFGGAGVAPARSFGGGGAVRSFGGGGAPHSFGGGGGAPHFGGGGGSPHFSGGGGGGAHFGGGGGGHAGGGGGGHRR